MERRRFYMAVQVFKVLHLLCPQYLRDCFMFAETITVAIWNSLPQICVALIVFQISRFHFKKLVC